MPSKTIYDVELLERELTRSQVKKRVHASILRHIFQLEAPKATLTEEVHQWSEHLKKEFKNDFLTLEHRSDSKVDGASKLLLKTHDGHSIEAVILRSKKESKNSVCISTQVGCTEQCRFCATAELPFKRNLTKDEICAQVLLMRRILKEEGKPLTHVVFMGMGEPLRNYDAVSKSLSILVSPRHFKLSPQSVTVSTLGIPKAMLAMATEHPQVHLALSLHAPNDELRRRIMPINDRHPVSELIETLIEIEQKHHYRVMISYLMLKGLNDQLEHAHELVQRLDGRRIIFNLIPYNPVENELHLDHSENDDFQAFKRVLIEAGFHVTIRRSFGPDIDAACGQLAAKTPPSPEPKVVCN
jgi:23S rRNA (adenine2503-C2)-methyltransferase